MNKVVYFTYGDVVADNYPTWIPNSATDMVFNTIMTDFGLVIEDSTSDKLAILYQLMRMVFARFYDAYVVKKNVECHAVASLTTSEKREVYRQLVGMFNLTAPRFIPLLQQFKGNEANPIAKITSTSNGTTRFNDTPQNSGDFDDDSHTTNITQTIATTETDTGSIMERLDALYKNWRSVLRDWSYEFRGLFYGL